MGYQLNCITYAENLRVALPLMFPQDISSKWADIIPDCMAKVLLIKRGGEENTGFRCSKKGKRRQHREKHKRPAPFGTDRLYSGSGEKFVPIAKCKNDQNDYRQDPLGVPVHGGGEL